MVERVINPFRKSAEDIQADNKDKKWLEFKFNCAKGKAEDALEILHKLGYRRYILDCTIVSVTARWSEIINGNTGEVGWVGTHIGGICREDQKELIVDAIFRAGAVEHGNDYYLNRIHFWDPSTIRRDGDITVEGLDSY